MGSVGRRRGGGRGRDIQTAKRSFQHFHLIVTVVVDVVVDVVRVLGFPVLVLVADDEIQVVENVSKTKRGRSIEKRDYDSILPHLHLSILLPPRPSSILLLLLLVLPTFRFLPLPYSL